MSETKIGNLLIGGKSPCFIIAEAGVNHNGDLKMATELVRNAKLSGADCVKFQTFKAERIVTKEAPKADYQLKTTDVNEIIIPDRCKTLDKLSDISSIGKSVSFAGFIAVPLILFLQHTFRTTLNFIDKTSYLLDRLNITEVNYDDL